MGACAVDIQGFACLHFRFDVLSAGRCDVGQQKHIQIHPAVVDFLDLGRLEFVVWVCDDIHDEFVLSALQWLDLGIVETDGSLDLLKVLSHGCKPLSIQMWQVDCCVFEDGLADAGAELHPRDDNSKHLSQFSGRRTPQLHEHPDLPVTLVIEQVEEVSSSHVVRTEQRDL